MGTGAQQNSQMVPQGGLGNLYGSMGGSGLFGMRPQAQGQRIGNPVSVPGQPQMPTQGQMQGQMQGQVPQNVQAMLQGRFGQLPPGLAAMAGNPTGAMGQFRGQSAAQPQSGIASLPAKTMTRT